MKRVSLAAWTVRLGAGLYLEPGALPGEYLLVTEAGPGSRMRHRIRGLVRCEPGGGLAVRTEEGITCRLSATSHSVTFLLDAPGFPP